MSSTLGELWAALFWVLAPAGCYGGGAIGESVGPLIGAVWGFLDGGAYGRNRMETGQPDGPDIREQFP